ncbi:MAG: cobalt chelatase, partial [Actinomycetota bacterium]|nr:cobalt chelatase [Actinomycetota bacterium]
MTIDEATRRRLERHGAAALRAVSGRPTAELRGSRLEVDARPVAMASPYMSPVETMTLPRSRGIADALGALLRYSDLDLHRTSSPSEPLARVVFDVLEQLRCEALLDPVLAGSARNLDAAFDGWCMDARNQQVGESAVGLLVYTVTHIARARLVRITMDEEVDALTETTRGNIGAIIGGPLRELRGTVTSQAEFAVHAVDIAERIAAFAGPVAASEAVHDELSVFYRMHLPQDWGADESHEAEVSAGSSAGLALVDLQRIGGYEIYSRAHDRQLDAGLLYPTPILDECRRRLDSLISAQAVSVHRLARRMRALFAVDAAEGWVFGVDEGVVDGRRLGQLVARTTSTDIFKRDRIVAATDAVVTFLIDNSGSMKLQRHESVAVLVDTLVRALDLAGVKSEVLGFTTGAWSGGVLAGEWRAAGSPEHPGRLNQTDHIIYKDADTSWRRSRRSVSALMRTHHFREGVDGEAVIWAH